MEFEQQEEEMPVSPISQYFNSSVLSVCIIGVLEIETTIDIDDSSPMNLLKDVFLPINPRFSSIMVTDKSGSRQWKKVEVNLKNHLKYARFPSGLSPTSYDEYFNEYLTNLGLEELPQSRPLWEVHVIKYPTSTAAGSVVFKMHHSLGDGYSLMGAFLSCLQRADDPSLPLTFPSRQSQSNQEGNKKKNLFPHLFSLVYNTLWDFGLSFWKSNVSEDEISPIRSGNPLVQYLPMDNTTITFSIDQIKDIKSNLGPGVTVNDVMTGIIFLGTRLYMKEMENESSMKSITGLAVLNTRMSVGYKSVKEMLNPTEGSSPLWGNQFAFLHFLVPEFNHADSLNPLDFIHKTLRKTKPKKTSLGFFLTAQVLELLRKLRGPEAVAKLVYNTFKNSSLLVTNVIGPIEQVSLANHPVSGIYFTASGLPQSLLVTILSYMGKLRLTIGSEQGFIVPQKYKSCIECAFKLVLESGTQSASKTK